jgi:hypothetical protein
VKTVSRFFCFSWEHLNGPSTIAQLRQLHTMETHLPILPPEEIVLGNPDIPEDIGLNLECEDDELYEIPTMPSPMKQPFPPGVDTRFEISFPVQHSDEPERISCSLCEKTFTRESLQKDHMFKSHGIEGLFKCEHCRYAGNKHRHGSIVG